VCWYSFGMLGVLQIMNTGMIPFDSAAHLVRCRWAKSCNRADFSVTQGGSRRLQACPSLEQACAPPARAASDAHHTFAKQAWKISAERCEQFMAHDSSDRRAEGSVVEKETHRKIIISAPEDWTVNAWCDPEVLQEQVLRHSYVGVHLSTSISPRKGQKHHNLVGFPKLSCDESFVSIEESLPAGAARPVVASHTCKSHVW
jgi:hypothetical protein